MGNFSYIMAPIYILSLSLFSYFTLKFKVKK